MKNWIAYAAVLLLLLRSRKTNASDADITPKGSYPGAGKYRGMKNNNPGNIRISANAWQGKIPVNQNTDGAFEQFESLFYGTRAALVNMRTHYRRGKNTVRKLVTTWAPYSDNPADAVDNYISAVASYAGLGRDQVFTWAERPVIDIAYKMFLVENAGEGPNKNLIKSAYDAI